MKKGQLLQHADGITAGRRTRTSLERPHLDRRKPSAIGGQEESVALGQRQRAEMSTRVAAPF